jgi:hypothetical protein
MRKININVGVPCTFLKFIRLASFSSLMILVGCDQSNTGESSTGNLGAINHVAGQDINWFSVNGYRVPGTGGGYCCIMLPNKWHPDLMAHIEWEVDPNPNARLPPLGTTAYNKAYAEHKAKYRQYSANVPIPEYEGACGLTVHLLTCHQVKVTTSCLAPELPDYPIKEPTDMQEPAICP